MSPRQILELARRRGLNVLAVTDHNASAQVETMTGLSAEFGVTVVPGMEVTSREEVHILTLFEEVEALNSFQRLVDTALPEEENNSEFFGNQLIYDATDEIIGVDERLRQVGTGLSLEQVVAEVKRRGGTVIAAHAFRPKYSLTSQLGWIDAESGFDALEIGSRQWKREGYRLGDRLEGMPVLSGSDSHFLEDIGRTTMEITDDVRTAKDIVNALRALGDRKSA